MESETDKPIIDPPETDKGKDDDDDEDEKEYEEGEDDLFVDLDIGANCESSVSLTALLVVGIIGGAVVFKKKED